MWNLEWWLSEWGIEVDVDEKESERENKCVCACMCVCERVELDLPASILLCLIPCGKHISKTWLPALSSGVWIPTHRFIPLSVI